MSNNRETLIKDLSSIIDKLSYSKSCFETFSNVIEICSITEHQNIFNLGLKAKDSEYEELEKKYLELINLYNKEERDLIVKFYGSLKYFFIKNNHFDILGSLYMALELSNKRTGQFFTPYDVSKMMASMLLPDIKDTVTRKGYFTICEPCIGAGGMVIAASDIMNSQNISKGEMLFQGIDIDRLCFNMSYVQLSMLGLMGVLIQGNSLSCEEFDKRKTPALLLNEDKLPKNLILNLSDISIRSKNPSKKHAASAFHEPKQLSLF